MTRQQAWLIDTKILIGMRKDANNTAAIGNKTGFIYKDNMKQGEAYRYAQELNDNKNFNVLFVT